MRRSYLLCTLAILAFSLESLISYCLADSIALSDAKTEEAAYFWYPMDKGGAALALAFIRGGPHHEPNDKDIQFFLFTLKNQDTSDELVIGDNGKLTASHYVPSAPLKLVAHGYTSSSKEGPGPLLKREYFRENQNYNVILIDWAPLAAAPWYERAATATKIVGQKTADLVNYLVRKGLVTYENIHFVGHSLGAHAGGFFGSSIGAGKIGRITGLDPALPLFENVATSGKLDASDAAFVDVIHTDGGTLAIFYALGHADFYPNGGERQLGCGIEFFGGCSHRRSYEYMQESINHASAFDSCQCNTWEEFNLGSCACTDREKQTMGEHANKSARGKFYLNTNSAAPWSQS